MYLFHITGPGNIPDGYKWNQAIPGASGWGTKRVSAPRNCAWLVERTLKDFRAIYKVEAREPTIKMESRFATNVRDFVPGFLAKHQNAGYDFAVKQLGSLLLHPAGSGKTATSILWAAADGERVVWVTRAISKLPHQREIVRFVNCDTQIIDGRSEVKIDDNAQFIIINWEILVDHWQTLCRVGFSSIVFDEIQKAKNPVRKIAVYDPHQQRTTFIDKRSMSNAAYQLSRKARRRIGTTATLVKNRLRDVWAPCDLVCPDQFGTRAAFMTRYAGRHVGQFGQIDDSGAQNVDELRNRIKLISHVASVKDTHANLPPLRRQTIFIPVNQQTTHGERQAAKDLQGIGPIEARLMLSAFRKREAVYELVEEAAEADQHVTVFTGRRADAEDLAKRIQKKIDCPVVMIHGGVSNNIRKDGLSDREALRQTYMNTKGACVLVATGDSMGEAIDLAKTDLAIMSMLPYTWAQLEQWEKRFWRLSSDRNVLIMYLIAQGTIDDRIASLLLSKLPPVAKLTEGADLDGMSRALLGGKSDTEIQSDLMSMILKGA